MSNKSNSRVVTNPKDRKKQKKKRFTIALSEDVDSRLEILSEQMGVTKAQAVSMMIGQSLYSWEQAWKMFSDPNKLGQLVSAIQLSSQNGNIIAQQLADGVKEGERLADNVLEEK